MLIDDRKNIVRDYFEKCAIQKDFVVNTIKKNEEILAKQNKETLLRERSLIKEKSQDVMAKITENALKVLDEKKYALMANEDENKLVKQARMDEVNERKLYVQHRDRLNII